MYACVFIIADAANNGNRKIGSAILDIVGFALLCNFIIKISFALTLDLQFIDKNIIIVPAIIGLMSLSNFYFVKRATLAVRTITTVINPVVEGIYLTIVKTTHPVVKRTALIVVTAIKICSTIVTAMNYVVRKPYIITAVSNTLEHKFNFHLTDNMSIALHFFVIIILAIDHLHFNRSNIHAALVFIIFVNIYTWYVNMYMGIQAVVAISIIIFPLCFSLLSYLHSYKSLLWPVVVLSITIFICDSVSSFVVISELLRFFCKVLMFFVLFDTVYHEGFTIIHAVF